MSLARILLGVPAPVAPLRAPAAAIGAAPPSPGGEKFDVITALHGELPGALTDQKQAHRSLVLEAAEAAAAAVEVGADVETAERHVQGLRVTRAEAARRAEALASRVREEVGSVALVDDVAYQIRPDGTGRFDGVFPVPVVKL